MASSIEKRHFVTESRFFSQEFNSAIIDGPLRIYFADRQESEALHVYFEVQQALLVIGKKLSSFPNHHPHLYLMMYPTRQSFINVFNWEEKSVFEKFKEHLVLGLDCSDGLQNPKAVSEELCQAFDFSLKARGVWPVPATHAEAVR